MSYLPAVLPLIGFVLLWWLATAHRERLGLSRLSRRGTFLVAFVVFEALLVLITEGLSIGHHLTGGTTQAAWLVVDVALGIGLVVSVGGTRLRSQMGRLAPRSLARQVREAPLAVVIGVLVIGAIVIVLVSVGLLYLPNNTDSLVYHLPRVAQWVQQSSDEHFATHYTAQLEFAPLHEFNVLHVRLLTAGERLDGFVELGAFVVCTVGASELARLLGARAEAQMGAALIAAVIPSAVLQATSTQNDVFAAAIGVAVTVLLVAWVPGRGWLRVAAVVGVAAGLAAIVKGVLPPTVGPVWALLAARVVWLERGATCWSVTLRRTAAATGIVLVTAVLIAGPFLKRNHDTFGTVTGPISSSTLNEVFSVQAAAGNVVRSVAVNFRVGDAGDGIEGQVQRAALGLGRELYELIGASQDDPRFVIGALSDAFAAGDYDYFSRTEEYGANPWHVILLVVSGGLFLVWAARGDETARLPALIVIGLVIGFVAFFATARWSLFVARYQIPQFVLWTPLIAIALSRLHRYVLRIVLVLLVVAMIPQLTHNSSRSLRPVASDWPSDLHAYFVHPGGDGFFVAPEDFVAARDAIVRSGCERLGISNWVLLEYPIWAGLEHAGWEGTIEHVDVENPSSTLEDEAFEPCALIRQTVGRPPLATPSGWTDQVFGGLAVSIDPDP